MYMYIYTYIHIIIYKSEVGFLFIYVFQKRQLLFSGHSFGFLQLHVFCGFSCSFLVNISLAVGKRRVIPYSVSCPVLSPGFFT